MGAAVQCGLVRKKQTKKTNKQIKTNHWNAIYNNNKTKACTLMAVGLIMALDVVYFSLTITLIGQFVGFVQSKIKTILDY